MSRRPPRGSSLADRFRAALETRSEQKRLEEERQREAQARLKRERVALMEDLQIFGESIGHFRVRSRRDRLELSFEGRTLRFVPQDDDSVAIECDNLTGVHSLIFEATIQKWVWLHKPQVGRPQQRLFFDAGLELLISFAFDIRPASPTPAVEPPDPDTGREL